MPQNSVIEFLVRGGAGAAGSSPPSGSGLGSTVEAGTESKSEGYLKKIVKVPDILTKQAKSSLGIQFSLAAMLRQSQIATGFLGAVFQVLGAIMDSFLVAFAPQMFSAIASLTTLIPIARTMGEEIAFSIGDLKARLEEIGKAALPILKGVGKGIVAIGRFLVGMPQIAKNVLIWAVIGAKLLNFFQVKFWAGMMISVFKGNVRANSVSSAGPGGKVGGLMGMNPWVLAGILAVAIGAAVVRGVVGSAAKNSATGVDVTGQLGKNYRPSQASQLGTDYNKEMSKLDTTFTASVSNFGEKANTIIGDWSTTAEEAQENWVEKMSALPRAAQDVETQIAGNVASFGGFMSATDKMAVDVKGVLDPVVAEYLKVQEKMTPLEKSVGLVTAAFDAMYNEITPVPQAVKDAKENIDKAFNSQMMGFDEGSKTSVAQTLTDAVVAAIDGGASKGNVMQEGVKAWIAESKRQSELAQQVRDQARADALWERVASENLLNAVEQGANNNNRFNIAN